MDNVTTSRQVKTSNPDAIIQTLDTPGAGRAYHEYQVIVKNEKGMITEAAFVKFQKGPIAESGVNGCQQEDLLAIVIDRLTSFQLGPYPCSENAIALANCQAALNWLNKRTEKRKQRGVEGKSEL